MTVNIDATSGSEAIKIGGVEAVPFDVNGLKIGAFNDGVITPAKLAQPLTSGTAVATTSGTAIDFTSIPSWVKKITITLDQVNNTGNSYVLIRIGDSGGLELTGYVSVNGSLTPTVSIDTISTGYAVSGLYDSNTTVSGVIALTLLDNNTWASSSNLIDSFASKVYVAAGSKTLSGSLDRVRLTSEAGTGTYVSGSINILYE